MIKKSVLCECSEITGQIFANSVVTSFNEMPTVGNFNTI